MFNVKDLHNRLHIPLARGDLSCFGELKTWQPDDLQEISLERDLRATARLCELLDLCSAEDAMQFRGGFEELARLGYAGYCFYDFASVSMQGIMDVFESLLRELVGDPAFEAIHKWSWTGEVLNARVPGSQGGVRMVFKNATEEARTSVAFCRFMRFDDRWGVEPGETTHVEVARRYRREFADAHPGHTPVALAYQDYFVLATMDLLDQLHPVAGAEHLGRRIPLTHALRDVGVGRWLEGDRTGHVFLNTDTSLGMEATSGFEALKTSICVGVELPAAGAGS